MKQRCPVIDVKKDEVLIGEEGNLCKLTSDQWNNFIKGVKSGELKEIGD